MAPDFEDRPDVPPGLLTEPERIAILRSLVQAELSATRPRALRDAYAEVPLDERDDFRHRLNAALAHPPIVEAVRRSSAVRRRAEELAQAVAPPLPFEADNREVDAVLRDFVDASVGNDRRYRYAVIVVPGYTPRDQVVAQPGLHPVAHRRVAIAAQDFRRGEAPFVLFTGANVYPRGTPYYEAVEMKKAWVAMGLPANRVLIDARARHSTTNLRNAGRVMLRRSLSRALITTVGGGPRMFDQDFYFSNPNLSTFHHRCRAHLGYTVGRLRNAGRYHTSFVPAPLVETINWRDVLDP